MNNLPYAVSTGIGLFLIFLTIAFVIDEINKNDRK